MSWNDSIKKGRILFKNVYKMLWWKTKLLFLGKFLPEMIKGRFLTCHLRPKFAKHVKSVSARKVPPLKMAIIIQGPIQKRNNFTLETIQLYQRIFEGAHIILSTWEGEDPSSLELAKQHGATVILNEKPANPSFFNINLQLKTTQAGLFLAKDLGVHYTLKTRTDQRFYRYDLFDFFMALMKAFPLKEQSRQKERIIGLSFAKYRIYGISDMFMFGNTQDLLNYWVVPEYEKGIQPYVDSRNKVIPPLINQTPVASEIYLNVKYLEHLNIRPNWTLDQSWSVICDYFCIVDATSLDIYWDKYIKLQEYRFTRMYDQANHRAFEFSDWLQFYIDRDQKWLDLVPTERWAYNNGQLVREYPPP